MISGIIKKMKDLQIELLEKSKELPMHLLLLADPSAEMISEYIHDCWIYTATLNGELIGCYALSPLNETSVEIKNIAVSEECQGKGIGTILIKDAIEKAKELGHMKIQIGTGNSSIGQLALYQKLGFIQTGVIEGFFQKNYPEPIFENGMACLDMIVLEREL